MIKHIFKSNGNKKSKLFIEKKSQGNNSDVCLVKYKLKHYIQH